MYLFSFVYVLIVSTLVPIIGVTFYQCKHRKNKLKTANAGVAPNLGGNAEAAAYDYIDTSEMITQEVELPMRKGHNKKENTNFGQIQDTRQHDTYSSDGYHAPGSEGLEPKPEVYAGLRHSLEAGVTYTGLNTET